jgi:hypothetical protein
LLNLLRAVAAAALALQSLAAAAQPPKPAPASEAAIDGLIAVLPDAALLTTVDRKADPAQLERLTGFNPGRADEIRPILETYQTCISLVVNESTLAMIRGVATQLGEAQVKRLTAFYGGPDFARFKELTDRSNRGETLSAADTAVLGGMFARYPIARYRDAVQQRMDAMAQDAPLITKLTKCSLDKKQALILAKLRYN